MQAAPPSQPAAAPQSPGAPSDPAPLPAGTGLFSGLVDAVARIRASLHTKLLAGFLLGAVLFLGMAALGLVITNRMSDRMATLAQLQDKMDRARQMEYLITAQSHYRTMALLTRDDAQNRNIAAAKKAFLDHLDAVERMGGPPGRDFFKKVREANDRFAASSERVLALDKAGRVDEALKLHLAEEHPISHELEAAMRQLEQATYDQMAVAGAAFDSDRSLFATMVIAFSVIGLLGALLVGFLLSWSVIRPIRQINAALEAAGEGDFSQRSALPNRDELGSLGERLNEALSRLSSMYEELRARNVALNTQTGEQSTILSRVADLRRYVAPPLADGILRGAIATSQPAARKHVTVCFVSLRGLTGVADRMEPEELARIVNEHLTVMAEAVARHGGTLGKHLGGAVMAFFGDPLPSDDHAISAVETALELRARLHDLQGKWAILATGTNGGSDEGLAFGIGISTGYAAVGNVGSPTQLEYTVLGHPANVAASLAKRAQDGQILVSDRTLVYSREWVECQEVQPLQLTSTSRPVRVYEIRAKAPAGSDAGIFQTRATRRETGSWSSGSDERPAR